MQEKPVTSLREVVKEQSDKIFFMELNASIQDQRIEVLKDTTAAAEDIIKVQGERIKTLKAIIESMRVTIDRQETTIMLLEGALEDGE